jgi:(2R)-ethylmalonyl-CoA mutase
LVREVMEKLRSEGLNVPVVVGGIIPPEDEVLLKKSGVAAVFTPKDYEVNRILIDLVKIVEQAAGKNAA